MKNVDEIRVIRKCECGNYMVDGFVNEELAIYYCKEECLDKYVTAAEQEESFKDGSLYWTDWYDDTDVFMIFDNQYVSLEDAEYIQDNFGNPSNKITVASYNLNRSVFTIRNGEQIELDEVS